MTENDQQQLGKTLWGIADLLRGAMNADDFRDYMLAFLFLHYISDNYEQAAEKELGPDYPDANAVGNGGRTPLSVWYEENPGDIEAFEKQMRLKYHYVIKPRYLWASIAHMAQTQDGELLDTLQEGFKYIENESFESTFYGLFSEINLVSDRLGKDYQSRNDKLCKIITKIAEELAEFSTDADVMGDAYEYLIGQFAAGSGKKAGEFHISRGLSAVVVATDLDQRFVVTTPTSSAAVRGTVFFVGVDEAQNLGWVCGLAGEVEVEISNQEETFAVTPNWGVWFEEGSGVIVAARELTEEERQSYYLLAGEAGVIGGLEAAEIEQHLERAAEDRRVSDDY